MEFIEYESSDLDWCEMNYLYSNNIVEFYNTISNLPYIFLSIIGVIAFNNMPCENTDKIMYGSLCVIGCTSFYFHMTLSLFGQLLDECSIVFLLVNALIMCVKDKCHKMYLRVYFCTHSVLMIWFPSINIPILFILGIIVWRVMRIKFRKYTDTSFVMYWNRSQVLFGLSVMCWLGDRFFCESVQFLQLHAVWHVLSAFFAYYAILVGIFIEYNRDDFYISQNELLPFVYKK